MLTKYRTFRLAFSLNFKFIDFTGGKIFQVIHINCHIDIDEIFIETWGNDDSVESINQYVRRCVNNSQSFTHLR